MRFWRYARLALLLCSGAFCVLCLFPLCTVRQCRALKASWSAALLDTLGVTVDADLEAVLPGSLLIANHISWIDIFVINAVLPAAFVSKAEVARWPLIGWLAARNETVFLQRGSRGHAHQINQDIAGILGAGGFVAVFPEGTTTDGTALLHFHAALIQPALRVSRPVIPLSLSYWDGAGQRSLAPRYDGDISLGQCLAALIAAPRTHARLVATPALGLAGEDRRTVAAAARAAIAEAAGLPLTNP